MIEKKERVIITFEKTTNVIKAEMLCKEANMPGRVIPVPTAISAGCGLCFMTDPSNREMIVMFLKEKGIDYESIYELIL
ncbi:MAG: DUF3343 domain-containing protein [Eubacterium sp.]|nr:DUF3343 domain-containing protein [Eubacterium sp.]